MLNRFTGGADRKAGLIAGRATQSAQARPEEIARAIVYLASDNASFVTGQILGGSTAAKQLVKPTDHKASFSNAPSIS